jgi:hypothetical protein
MKIHTEANSTFFAAPRFIACWTLFLGFFIASSALANIDNPIEFVELGFFEGAENIEAPEWDSQNFKSSFSNSRTRYIYTLINLKNNLWQIKQQEVYINVRYYHSDGRLLAEPIINAKVPADWEYANLWAKWGTEAADQWENGQYRVELWLNNNQKISEGFFQIKSNMVSTSRSEGVAFDKIGFYEAGPEDEAPSDWNDSRITNNFIKNDSRYIYTKINLKNLHWKVRDQSVSIHLRYYHSDGRLFGDPVIDYDVPKDWENAELWNGWGWPDPGEWPADRYRVELWLNNIDKIGEGHFTVH